MGFPIGLLWCGVSSSRKSVQDVVLRTTVIYDGGRGGQTAVTEATFAVLALLVLGWAVTSGLLSA